MPESNDVNSTLSILRSVAAPQHGADRPLPGYRARQSQLNDGGVLSVLLNFRMSATKEWDGA